jgi:hypothetical protein
MGTTTTDSLVTVTMDLLPAERFRFRESSATRIEAERVTFTTAGKGSAGTYLVTGRGVRQDGTTGNGLRARVLCKEADVPQALRQALAIAALGEASVLAANLRDDVRSGRAAR